MARAGVYFSDVKRARDQLVAQGRRPSIDAIRAALGDTGSKTTIHKYLRELDGEETVQNRTVSDAVLALANQLADQLKQDADVDVAAVRAEITALRDEHAAALAAANAQLEETRAQLAAVSAQLTASQNAVANLQDQLHAQQVARSTAEQRSADLGERLHDAQQHQASLEDKHRHARDALEHFRTAAREQRDQETRRHAQQMQVAQVELRQAQQAAALRQEELTRLNKEAAALVAELAAGKQAAFLDRENSRHLARQITRLQAAESRVTLLEGQLADSRARVVAHEDAARLAADAHDVLQQEVQKLKATLEAEVVHAKSLSTLEERLAKLDQAVFGAHEVVNRPNADKSP